ncbi:autotransporter outer membrane beta-barrel domain-containing protein [Bartonella callosciuri]|uniref:autotransporter family protein n=1 Tax=Bartonella callosciuri TaxID=686223 RepID=UPI001605766E|nr:autotransporter outer membrane beta-barrel domain-containing protein [Bartonella callosciuri]
MIKRVSKSGFYSCVFIAIIFSFLSDRGVEAHYHPSISFLCDEGKLPYRCSDGAKHKITDKIYQFIKSSKEENGHGDFLISSAVIVAQEPGTVIQASHVTINNFDGVEGAYGVIALQGGKVILSDSIFKNVSIGLLADSGTIEANRGVVEATQVGVYAEKSGTSVILTDAKIQVSGQDIGQNAALFSGADANIKMTRGSIEVTNAAALRVRTRGSAILDSVTITSESQKAVERENADEEDNTVHAALNVSHQGILYLKNTNVLATDVRGLQIGLDSNAQLSEEQEGSFLVSRVNIEDSKITVTGNKHGMHFDIDKKDKEYKQGIVFLKKAVFDVPDGTVIHSSKSSAYLAVTAGTEISGDLLLAAEKGASVAILADSSLLTGGTRVSDDSIAEIYLTGGSQWVLTRRKRENLRDLNHGASSISFVKLSESSIAFEAPMFQEYQTLYIGKGEEEVYNAQESAYLYLNTHLNSDGLLDNKKTDRLLIHGNVSGKTTVHVQLIIGNKGGAGDDENVQSVSLIQVSGKAAEDSFQLSSPYIALEGLPYQYYLHAYGPDSTLGKAQTAQRLVKGDGGFWDFRLESKYIKPTHDIPIVPHSELKVREVVPQVPTYLLLPNTLFHTGLVEIRNHNKHLNKIQNVSSELLKADKSLALSMQGYGGNYHYISDLSAIEYGYGGDLDYNAIEASILLKTVESTYSKTSFGFIGSYGKVSLRPRDVKQSQKSVFHKWLVTTYGSIKHDGGFYMDALLSYGLFKGHVFTFARGKAATLKGNPLNVSLAAGKAFMMGYEDFVFNPQIQLIYQNLQFHKSHDIDGFDIDMGKFNQWIMRIGGRLTKTFTASENDRVISFYGKIHLSHHFGEEQFIHFKDTFRLGSFGSSVEAALGVNSQLSPKITLYGDLNYQHKLTKAGFSGIQFSGGLRYRF